MLFCLLRTDILWYHYLMKRGPKPKGNVSIRWNPEFAYAIGLLVSDGCLSKDGRHVSLTSKDHEQLVTFNGCLGLTNKISEKLSGAGNISYHTQFGDVIFYQFLQKIGLSPAKSKIIGDVIIPKQYFFDYLRGYFDGDGCSYSYNDRVWPNSYRFYISFASGSEKHFDWLRAKLAAYAKIKGSISRKKGTTDVQLKFAKREAEIIAKKMYYQENLVCLERKRLKVLDSLNEINLRRSGEIGKHAAFRTL